MILLLNDISCEVLINSNLRLPISRVFFNSLSLRTSNSNKSFVEVFSPLC